MDLRTDTQKICVGKILDYMLKFVKQSMLNSQHVKGGTYVAFLWLTVSGL